MASRTVRKGVVSQAGFIESDDDLDEAAPSNVSYQERVHNLIQLFQETNRDRKSELAGIKNLLKKQQLLILESEAKSLRKEQQMKAAIQSLRLTRQDTSSLTNDDPSPSTTTAATTELHRPPVSFLGAEGQADNTQVRPRGYNKGKLPKGCIYVKKAARATTLPQENERNATSPSSHIGKTSTPFSISNKKGTHNPEDNSTGSYHTKKPTRSEAKNDITFPSSFGKTTTPFSITDNGRSTNCNLAGEQGKRCSHIWDTPMPSLISSTASSYGQKENCPISGSYGKIAYATTATWREGEESCAFPARRVDEKPKPCLVTDNTSTPGQNAAKPTPVQQKKGNLLSSGPQTEITHGQSLASETPGTQDTSSQVKKSHSQSLASQTTGTQDPGALIKDNHNQSSSSEIAGAQETLFVDDEVPEEPIGMEIPGHLIAQRYTEMIWSGDKVPKVTLKLVAPPHSGTSTLLFHKWSKAPDDNEPRAQYWRFGSTPDDGTVDATRPGDILLDYSPDNMKVLVHVFFKLKFRRGELRRGWFRENKHARDIVAIEPDPYAEPMNRTLSAAARSKLKPFIPAKIGVVIPVTGRQGGIDRRKKGSVVELRVLFLRGTRVVKKEKETWNMVYRTRGDKETKLTPEDVVFPKDEDTFLALYRFYSTLQDADIMVPDESKKRPASTLESFDDVTKKAKFT
ncbi:hypothetical protein GE09DRAFT_1254844 [Coniochaeta sp. 2T2.1]|nr:hypothetical protein GE09DRAFT_1254844 [Coniochaeta sp. 2T2.1]